MSSFGGSLSILARMYLFLFLDCLHGHMGLKNKNIIFTLPATMRTNISLNINTISTANKIFLGCFTKSNHKYL